MSSDPRHAMKLFNEASRLLAERQSAAAIELLNEAAELSPEQPAIPANLGEAHALQGRTEEARSAYDRAIELARGSWALRFRRSLLLPVIYDSVDHIRSSRERLITELTAMAKKQPGFRDLVTEVGHRGFMFAYHGMNNRDIHTRIAAAMAASCPSLVSHPSRRVQRRTGRQRLGIFSAHFRDHTVGRVNVGFLRNLPRDLFNVTVIRPEGEGDQWTKQIDAAADSVLQVPYELAGARKAIGDSDFDVLLYADIGMEPLSYALSFSRLAPLQAVLWGHPDTTGVPSVDYYISCETNEPENGQSAYTEKLALLPRNYVCLERPATPPTPLDRAALGVGSNEHFYLCPQMLFKLHPDFDPAIDALLRADKKGVLMLPAAPENSWTELLRARLERTCPETVDRVRFFPLVSIDEFPSLLAAADVIVDSPQFSGGYTSYLAMGVGAPVVTWDAKFMRGRMTLGLYKQMGIEGLVAGNTDEFVEIATGMAVDRKLHREKRQQILDLGNRIFDDADSVHRLGQFLMGAEVKRHR